ncbi:class I SAM-dependent methyltransferase [Barnesiella viscericola]|uniref:class I SAM-dependent methyltransferase n=1 Tax=Barnesiella viscericola TaxID=397865 RepID=UPI002357043D|nr:class I SAM-dependent methyltransferase [Barnesiella viscericola]
MNFFDEMAGVWDRTSRPDADRLGNILSILHLSKGEKVLDVGTGTGVMIPFIRERVGPYTPIVAVDSSEKMLREASWRYAGEGVHFIRADVERDRLAGRFDAIVLYSVFPHFRYPVDTIARLVTDNLCCGGRLLIAHTQGRKHLNQIHERLLSRVFSRQLLPAAEQAGEFARVGLTVTSFGETDDYYYLLLQRVGVGHELSVSIAEAIYE